MGYRGRILSKLRESKETARLWLEGMQNNQVELVTLIRYEETPSYSCPLPAGESPSTQDIPLDLDDIRASDTVCTSLTGPVTYKDDKEWVRKSQESPWRIGRETYTGKQDKEILRRTC